MTRSINFDQHHWKVITDDFGTGFWRRASLPWIHLKEVKVRLSGSCRNLGLLVLSTQILIDVASIQDIGLLKDPDMLLVKESPSTITSRLTSISTHQVQVLSIGRTRSRSGVIQGITCFWARLNRTSRSPHLCVQARPAEQGSRHRGPDVKQGLMTLVCLEVSRLSKAQQSIKDVILKIMSKAHKILEVSKTLQENIGQARLVNHSWPTGSAEDTD